MISGSALAKVSPLIALLAVTGCTSLVSKDRVSVDYYAISGNSTAALDREIQRKGPRVDGGRHAVAVARIRIIPKVRYARFRRGCRVSHAKVNVDAKVTLPRWTGRATASPQLGAAWDNIDRYTRLHEAVHVAIAFRYAKGIEESVADLTLAGSCDQLKQQVQKLVSTRLEEHDFAQRDFDAKEQRRFALLAKRSKKSKP